MRWKDLFERLKRDTGELAEEKIGAPTCFVMDVVLHFMSGGMQVQRDGNSLRNWQKR